ncbi:hypothetical protein WLQ65_05235 [Pseudoalteromonas piscicida]|uniref:hypothetical protein n=1 Tax=Pseudoalteromonas piscicida TaxID=43662 RepID=UPI0030C929E3
MKYFYTPPLSLSFVWHPSDSDSVEPILDSIRTGFARDKSRPFSRGLNIPLFFYSSLNSSETPDYSPTSDAKRHVIFVFTSVNTLGRKNWQEYIESIPQSELVYIVPVALDVNGLSHGGELSGLNCLRMYEWPEDELQLYAVVYLAHEIYRFGFSPLVDTDEGKRTSINLFLSHAKSGDIGRRHSESLKQFIDNTNMNRFFDANEISPGFPFNKEIENHIKNCTLLAIETDAYSSRYWCQREILLAKKYNRPIIIINCLDEYEDRVFPAASNVPCIHISPSIPIISRDILRILSASLFETIRFTYSMECLKSYKHAGWIDARCTLIARPPEIRQVINFIKAETTKICYPEPPIYPDEADWHEYMGIEAYTPLWNPAEQDCLSKARIGLSISDVKYDGFSNNHLHSDNLVRLSQDIARHLLARSATLVYGGDLRPGGFTEFVLDEARILSERLQDSAPHVENHLAWPLYISDPEITAWRAKYYQVMNTVEHDIPSDIIDNVSRDIFLPPNTPKNLYSWSRCLTEMREKSIFSSSERICAGGRSTGYKGCMPGVLEEIIIAIKEKKPLFLMGGFGGIVKDVCRVILDHDIPSTLTDKWQIEHNEGYAELQEIAHGYGRECKYEHIVEMLLHIKVPELASRCGLDEDEYKRLMTSPFVDECVYILIKGLRTIRDK